MSRRLRGAPRPGFSLVEILIALGIVLILTGLVAGVYQTPLEDAKVQVLQANLRAMRRALRDFYNDHGRYPYNGQDNFGNVVAFLDPNTSELVNGVHDDLGHYPAKRTRYLYSIPVDPTLTDPIALWQLISFDNDGDGSCITIPTTNCDEDPFGGGDQDIPPDGKIDEDPPDVRDIRSYNPDYEHL